MTINNESPSMEFFNTTEIHCSPFLTEEYSHSHNGHDAHFGGMWFQ